MVDEAAAADAAAVAAARAAFDSGRGGHPVAERGALLHRIADLLQRDKDRSPGPRPRHRQDAAGELHRHRRRHRGLPLLRRPGRRRPRTAGRDRRPERHQPGGARARRRVRADRPWNYPLLQMSWKVAPALAAGARGDQAERGHPADHVELVELLVEAGVPAGVVNIVLGQRAGRRPRLPTPGRRHGLLHRRAGHRGASSGRPPTREPGGRGAGRQEPAHGVRRRRFEPRSTTCSPGCSCTPGRSARRAPG